MNDGRKKTRHLSCDQACLLVEGFFTAYCIGKPLNRWMNMHWESGGCRENVHEALSAFHKYMSDWLRLRTGRSLHAVWVLENGYGDDGVNIGLHSHSLLHVPDKHWLAFRRKLRGWLKATGVVLKPKVLQYETVHDWHEQWREEQDGLHDLYLEDCVRIVSYMLKGIAPQHAGDFSVTRPSDEGIVVGKRAGRTENLNPRRIQWSRIPLRKFPKLSIAGPELRNLHHLRQNFAAVLPSFENVGNSNLQGQ